MQTLKKRQSAIKRVMVCLIGCFCVMATMAQTSNVQGEVFDSRHEPIVGASVRVAGTQMYVVTDIDGKFLLRDVPVDARELIIEFIGMETKKVRLDTDEESPVKIRMHTQVIKKRISWFVKVGGGMSQFIGVQNSMFSSANPDDNLAFYGGVGADIKISKHLAFQPAVMLFYCNMEDYSQSPYNGFYQKAITQNPLYLEIPLLLALKFRVAPKANIVFNFGPYVDFGLSGDQKTWSYHAPENGQNAVSGRSQYTTSLFGKRFTGGGMVGLGFEVGEHFLVGSSFKLGATSMDHAESYMTLSVELGYKF